MTPRMAQLFKYLSELDPTKRHRITIECRGAEPYEIEEHVTRTRIELKEQARRDK